MDNAMFDSTIWGFCDLEPLRDNSTRQPGVEA